MPFISVTRLHLRSWRFVPGFLFYTFASARQTKKAQGFITGALASDAERGWWTLTVWRDEASMRAFRTSGAHLKAMPRLLDWCDEAAVIPWTDADASLPAMDVAFRRLRDEGRVSKVHFPSARHAAGQTVASTPPRVGVNLRPSSR